MHTYVRTGKREDKHTHIQTHTHINTLAAEPSRSVGVLKTAHRRHTPLTVWPEFKFQKLVSELPLVTHVVPHVEIVSH